METPRIIKANIIQQEEKLKRIELYNLSPTRCKNCDTAFSYEKRNNTFCSLSCSTLYNNKLRAINNYEKMICKKSESGKIGAEISNKKQQETKKQRIEQYNLNPTCCKNCNTPFPYEKKSNSFCNSSCAATYNNKIYVKRIASKEIALCPNCNAELYNQKYCSNVCQR